MDRTADDLTAGRVCPAAKAKDDISLGRVGNIAPERRTAPEERGAIGRKKKAEPGKAQPDCPANHSHSIVAIS